MAFHSPALVVILVFVGRVINVFFSATKDVIATHFVQYHIYEGMVEILFRSDFGASVPNGIRGKSENFAVKPF